MVVQEKKKKVVEEIKNKITQSQSVILTDYRGLNVSQINDLRNRLSQEGIEYSVVKNTLTRIAAKEAGYEGLSEFLQGPTAIAYGQEDPVAPAKILSVFAKENDKLGIKGGLLDGKIIDILQIKALSDLPSREVLLSMVVGGMQAPVYGIAYAMQGMLLKTVYALKAISDKKEQEA